MIKVAARVKIFSAFPLKSAVGGQNEEIIRTNLICDILRKTSLNSYQFVSVKAGGISPRRMSSPASAATFSFDSFFLAVPVLLCRFSLQFQVGKHF